MKTIFIKSLIILIGLFTFLKPNIDSNWLNPQLVYAEGEEEPEEDGTFTPLEPINDEQLDQLDPLLIGTKGNESLQEEFSTPAGIINRFLLFAFPLAGLILFVMIVWGGFDMLAKSATKKSMDSGKQRITAAVIGFILLFASYWIIQILEIITGAQIL